MLRSDPVSLTGFSMSFRSGLVGLSIALLVIPRGFAAGQTEHASSPGANLQQEYDSAQALQRAGKLNEAAQEYRTFVADAIGELAMGYAVIPDYAHSARLFEEALAAEPGSTSLLLDYARTALALGDLERARSLAASLIAQRPADHRVLAQAHQILGRALLKLNRDQDARKELELAVALDPTFGNGYDLAVACLDLDDERCAVQIFTEMQASFGDTAKIHLAFGRAYGDSDFQPRAIAELRKAIEEDPRLPHAHYLLAAVLLATTNDATPLESAETELKKELAISPQDAMTYAALGKIELTRKNYPEAETYLGKAISLSPTNPDAYLYLGQVFVETNQPDKAEEALRKCVALTKDISRNRYQVQKAHYLLGRILMKQGKPEAAHAEMLTSRELADKTLSQDKSRLAGLTDSPEPQTAEAAKDVSGDNSGGVPPGADPAALSRVDATQAKLKDALADSYNNLGAIAATNTDYTSAVTYFKRAAEWNPALDGLDFNWGRAAFAASLFADAVGPLSRYSKLHPEDTGASAALGFSQFMTGDYRGCVKTLKPLDGKSDLAPQVEYGYAESFVKLGQVTTGMEHLSFLEKSHPEIPDVHRALGEALLLQGNHKQAIDELRAAIKLAPNDADSHFDLGKIELNDSDTAAALPELETAVRLSPKNADFHRELAKAYAAALRPSDAQRETEAFNSLKAAK